MNGNKLGWGLIGASTIAREWMIDAIRAQDGCDIVGVMSSNAERGAAFAAENQIDRSYHEVDALLAESDVDVVYISTTNELHHGQALRALDAGKHVLCEKPLAMSLGEAREMVEVAAGKGLTFGTNHHLRCAGSHAGIRQLIANGDIGEVLSIRVFHAVELPRHLRGWRIDNRAAGGGVIVDITVHDADTVRFYLGEDPVEVVATSGMSGMGRGVEDSVMSIWTLPSGAMVQTHESFTHRYARTGIEVHGTRGSIHAKNVMSQRAVGEVILVDGSGTHPVEFSTHNLYQHSVGAFVGALSGNGRPAADGEDGVRSLAVALAVREAAETRRAIIVDYGANPQ